MNPKDKKMKPGSESVGMETPSSIQKKDILFVFDMDGTLLPHSRYKLGHIAIKAMQRAASLAEIIFASARPYRGVLHLLSDKTPKPLAIIALNGGALHMGSRLKPFRLWRIPSAIVDMLLQNLANVQDIWLYTATDWYANHPTSKACRIEQKAVGFSPIPISPGFKPQPVLKVTIITPDNFHVQSILNCTISGVESVSITESNQGYTEISPRSTNKLVALETVIKEKYKVTPLLVAIGDSDNDFELLSGADIACVVSNATKKVREVAHFVSSQKYGIGVFECVEHAIQKITF